MTTTEDLGRAWEQYKVLNDAALAEAKKHGETSAEAKLAADRANNAISEIQTKVQDIETKRAEDRKVFDELESRHNALVIQFGGSANKGITDERRLRYAAFESAVKRTTIDPANVDLDWVGNYQAAFRDYMKFGKDGLNADRLTILNAALAGDNPSGGFYVEPDMNGRLVEFLRETSPVRGLTNPTVTSGDRLIGKVQLGQAGSGWVGETEARPATDAPTVNEWEIPLREQYAMPEASQRIIDQASISIQGWFETQVRGRLLRDEATAFVTGNTPKRPRGFTTYDAGTPGDTPITWPFVEQVNSGHASTLTADGLHALVASLFPQYLRNAVFGMRRATELVVRQMKDGNGNYLWQPDFSAPAKGQLLGYPVVLMADMPAIAASAEPVVFADFAEAYQIVDSPVGMRVLVDPYTNKPYVRFYTTRYVGGDVVNFQAIKLQTVSA